MPVVRNDRETQPHLCGVGDDDGGGRGCGGGGGGGGRRGEKLLAQYHRPKLICAFGLPTSDWVVGLKDTALCSTC
ncbi:unnamed protein product [Echinostoma caproni]|uniref:Uncharacterized protein n=1 Tax=Echinostoma caproni TaxID=27848 RepID=A0A183AW05_9TREM|nr:unnamed protein product [Echinostoma caproni]